MDADNIVNAALGGDDFNAREYIMQGGPDVDFESHGFKPTGKREQEWQISIPVEDIEDDVALRVNTMNRENQKGYLLSVWRVVADERRWHTWVTAEFLKDSIDDVVDNFRIIVPMWGHDLQAVGNRMAETVRALWGRYESVQAFNAREYFLSKPRGAGPWPPKDFTPHGPKGKYGHESQTFKSADGRDFKLNIHNYPKDKRFILSLFGFYFGHWLDSGMETIGYEDDLPGYIEATKAAIAKSRSTRYEMPRMPDPHPFRYQEVSGDLEEAEDFDAAEYLSTTPEDIWSFLKRHNFGEPNGRPPEWEYWSKYCGEHQVSIEHKGMNWTMRVWRFDPDYLARWRQEKVVYGKNDVLAYLQQMPDLDQESRHGRPPVDEAENEFDAREYFNSANEASSFIIDLVGRGWNAGQTRKGQKYVYQKFTPANRDRMAVAVFAYPLDASNEVYFHVAGMLGGDRVMAGGVRPENAGKVIDKFAQIVSFADDYGEMQRAMQQALIDAGGKPNDFRVLESGEDFDPREYLTRRVPDAEELRMRGAQKEDWGWRITDKAGNQYCFFFLDPMWSMVQYGPDKQQKMRASDYLTTLLDIMDQRIALLPESEDFNARDFLLSTPQPRSLDDHLREAGFRSRGNAGRYPMWERQDLTGETPQAGDFQWLITVFPDAEKATVYSYTYDAQDQRFYSNQKQWTLPYQALIDRLPNLRRTLGESEGFDAREYVMSGETLPEALEAAGFWMRPGSSKNRPLYERIDSNGGEEGPRVEGDKMWQVTIWDEDMAILYLLEFSPQPHGQAIAWGWHFHPTLGERRMSHRQLIDLLPRLNREVVESDFDVRDYFLTGPDVRYAIQFHNKQGRGNPMYFREAGLTNERDWVYDVSKATVFSSEAKAQQELAAEKERRLDTSPWYKVVPVKMDLDTRTASVLESEDFDPREYFLDSGVDELRAWLESANFKRSRTATNESWQKLVFRGQGHVTKFWVWEAPDKPGLWYLQRTDSTPHKHAGVGNKEDIIFQHHGNPAQILFACKRFVVADPFKPRSLNRIGGFEEALADPGEFDARQYMLNSDETALEEWLIAHQFKQTDPDYWIRVQGLRTPSGDYRRYDQIVHKEPGADVSDNPRLPAPSGEWVYRCFLMAQRQGPGGTLDHKKAGTANEVLASLEQWEKQKDLRRWIYGESDGFDARAYLGSMKAYEGPPPGKEYWVLFMEGGYQRAVKLYKFNAVQRFIHAKNIEQEPSLILRVRQNDDTARDYKREPDGSFTEISYTPYREQLVDPDAPA